MKALRLPAHTYPLTYWFRLRGPRLRPCSCPFFTLPEAGGRLPGLEQIVHPAAPIGRRRLRGAPAGSHRFPGDPSLRLCPAPGPRPDQRNL